MEHLQRVAAPAPVAGNRGIERRRSERRRAERARSEALDHLFRGLAHDLNNFLAILQAQVETLAVTAVRDENVQRSLAVLGAVLEHGQALSNSITTAWPATTEAHYSDVNDVVTSSAAIARPLLGTDVTLDVDLGAAMSSAPIPWSNLERVLLNLVMNASGAMPDGGRITMSTTNEVVLSASEQNGGSSSALQVVVQVTDTGSGMDAETRSRVFDADFTTKDLQEGHGSGLATCRALVAECGGFIDVRSAPDQGSTFKVYLPAALPEATLSS